MSKAQSHTNWKIPVLEAYTYKSYYCHFFNIQHPEFSETLQELLPFFLSVFGEYKSITSETEFEMTLLGNVILQKDYRSLQLFIENGVFVRNEKISSKKLEKECVLFINKFHEILRQYKLFSEIYDCQTNKWFCYSVFFSVCCGFTNLNPLPVNPYPLHPKEVLFEVWETVPSDYRDLVMYQIYLRYKQSKVAEFTGNIDLFFKSWNELKESPFFPIYFPNLFYSYDSYEIFEDMKDYEKRAVKDFKAHLKTYLKTITNTFKKHGYKINKKDEYNNIERLVIWNKYNFEYLWEILPHIKEFEWIEKIEDTRKKDKAEKSASNRLAKTFEKCETLGLPVRPFGHKRKNSKQKTGVSVSGAKK